MHIVELAHRLRTRTRSAALVIQRAWSRYHLPLRQAIVCGPRNYTFTRMVHELGGFYQTHTSRFTTHFIAEAEAPPPEFDFARVRCPQWLYRLHASHASQEQRGLGRSPACNAHDGPVNLPLLAHCDLEVTEEYFNKLRDGTFAKQKRRVITCHVGNGYMRTDVNAPTDDVVLTTCTYRAVPPGTIVGPMVNSIIALVLQKCPNTRRLFCMRRGQAKQRFARLLQCFLLNRLPRTAAMVVDRFTQPPVYRSMAASAVMAPTGEQHMRRHLDDPSAPYYRRYSRGLNVDVTCTRCNRMHIVPLGYGTFDGATVVQRSECPPCRARGPGSTRLVASCC